MTLYETQNTPSQNDVEIESPGTQKLINPSYGQLRKHVIELQRQKETGEQQLRNRLTALNAWQNFIGATDEDAIGDEFGPKFLKTFDRFFDFQTDSGLAERTVRDRLEFLSQWKAAFDEMGFIDDLPAEFGDALAELMRRAKLTPRELGRLCGLHKDTLTSWVTKRYVPRQDVVTRVAAIERVFALPVKTLISRLGLAEFQWYARIRKEDAETRRQTKNSKRMSERLLSKNFYTLPPTDFVRDQWLQVIRFKTDPLRDGAKARNTWRTKEAADSGRKADWSSQIDGKVCATAAVQWGQFNSYFGWLAIAAPEGGGIPSEDCLNMFWLIHAKKLLAHTDWLRRRASGVAHNGMKSLLDNVRSFLRPETGWLWLNYEVALTVPAKYLPFRYIKGETTDAELEAAWKKACEEARAVLKKRTDALREPGVLKLSRDPKAPIAAILAQPRPLDVVLGLVQQLENNPPPLHNKRDYPTWLRDVVLMKMLVSNPLRVSNFATMRYRADNTGNLYQDVTGAWRLRFLSSDFKNEKGAASDDYDVPVPEYVWGNIERYLAEGRPVLRGSGEYDYMFLPWAGGHPSKNVDRFGIPLQARPGMWDADSISNRVSELSLRYLPGNPPFRGHAIRHIVATDHLKRHPGSYTVVAHLLHDKLETVIRAYSHTQVSDGLQVLHDAVGDYFERGD